MKYLVTGCYGFVARYVIQKLLATDSNTVLGIGRGNNLNNKRRLEYFVHDPRLRLVECDFSNPAEVSGVMEDVDYVIHAGAKTFVDHSIADPGPFIQSNIVGTFNLLEQARYYHARYGKPRAWLQVSTDEVYGAILEGAYSETAPLNPTNPYAATKAAGDLLALSYRNTYKLDTRVSRSENVCGGWQDQQKVFPKFVKMALQNQPLPVYGDGEHRRMWIHVEDNVTGLLTVLHEGKPGEVYHVAGSQELPNIELARMILDGCGKPQDSIQFIDDFNIRPGHDRRYALDSTKLRALGWAPKYDLGETVARTVLWYLQNPSWLA